MYMFSLDVYEHMAVRMAWHSTPDDNNAMLLDQWLSAVIWC